MNYELNEFVKKNRVFSFLFLYLENFKFIRWTAM